MLYSAHKAHSALGGILAMALAAGCLVTTAFAADLNKNDTPVIDKQASVSVSAVSRAGENGALTPDVDVTYTIVTADGEVEVENMEDVLSLKDMKDLGDGTYQVTTTVDGEEIVLTLSFDEE